MTGEFVRCSCLEPCVSKPTLTKPHAMSQYGGAYAVPWTRGLARGVAMNAPQYGRSEPCGMCIAYRGTGRGSGADPVPVARLQYALVTDLCPECAHGEASPLLLAHQLAGIGRVACGFHETWCSLSVQNGQGVPDLSSCLA